MGWLEPVTQVSVNQAVLMQNAFVLATNLINYGLGYGHH